MLEWLQTNHPFWGLWKQLNSGVLASVRPRTESQAPQRNKQIYLLKPSWEFCLAQEEWDKESGNDSSDLQGDEGIAIHQLLLKSHMP